MARQPMVTTPEEAEKAVDTYFAWCKKTDTLAGEAGLALQLGLRSTKTLKDWRKGKGCDKEMQEVIERAYLLLTNDIETNPHYREKGQSSVQIFKMKQAQFSGYVDKQEAKQDLSVHIKIGDCKEDLMD